MCQLCCVSTHWRPVFGSCRCVNCVVYPRIGDLYSGLVGVSIVLCIDVLRISAETINGTIDYSVGMILLNSLTHYSIIR